jgi:uncharacterized membrane protein YedE/YeeE
MVVFYLGMRLQYLITAKINLTLTFYFMNLIFEPWPWYVAGPLIALVMILFLIFGKSFGVSSNLRTICSIAGASKMSTFFDIDWKSQAWNLFFLMGAIIGGFIANQFLMTDNIVLLNPKTIDNLNSLGIDYTENSFVPESLFGMSALTEISSWLFLVIGGVLVGFGARYAGGCTSGHAISGLSNLQIPSLIAVIGFFIGGLAMTHLILPLILS